MNNLESMLYSRVDMHGVAYEAVFIYCECAATKQIGLPGGEKVAIYEINFQMIVLMFKHIANFYE